MGEGLQQSQFTAGGAGTGLGSGRPMHQGLQGDARCHGRQTSSQQGPEPLRLLGIALQGTKGADRQAQPLRLLGIATLQAFIQQRQRRR